MEKVVGLTSPIAAGMWVVHESLQERGFRYFSLADQVRDEAERQGLGNNRASLQEVGNRLRRESGSTVLVRRAIEAVMRQNARWVILDSLRNPDEVRFVKEKLKGIVIGVNAPVGVRFNLMKTRLRQIDPLVFDEFLKVDKVDFGQGQDSYGHHIPECLRMADILFEHQGDLEGLKKKTQFEIARLF